jgi:hypothetical protein
MVIDLLRPAVIGLVEAADLIEIEHVSAREQQIDGTSRPADSVRECSDDERQGPHARLWTVELSCPDT